MKPRNVGRYPEWIYFPNRARPPAWALDFIALVAEARSRIDSAVLEGLTSDLVLSRLRPELRKLGYLVEASKNRADRIRRPVLFTEQGEERVAYEVDGVNDKLGIVLEIEAGRGARGNAVYRDLIRTSLVVGARFLVLGVMRQYRHRSRGREVIVPSYLRARADLDAIFASGRLTLPFEGILLFGY